MMLTLQILGLILCLIGSAYFSGMETGVISIHKLRLRHRLRQGVPGAKTLTEFREDPDHLLGTTLVGTNICNVVSSVLATSICVTLLGTSGYGFATVSMTIIVLIFGEYLPKAWFQSSPITRTRPLAGTLRFFGYVFYPVSRAVTAIAKILIPAKNSDSLAESLFVTKDEIRHLTNVGEQAGELTADKRRMIHSVFDLSTKTCGDVMLPREQLAVVTADTPVDDVLKLAREKTFSRFPVFHKDSDNFVGIANIGDMLAEETPEGKVGDFMRPPQFVTENTRLDQLLARMRTTRQPMALVTDQQSQVLGLVTTDVILQELFGVV